jgi:predicted CoA-binding protein
MLGSMDTVTKLREILGSARVIAIVGLSEKPHRPSYFVAKYLLEHGYKVIPVNPRSTEILGFKCYASLSEIPEPVDIVDCFRVASEMPDIATQAVAINAKVLWMQLSVINEEAASIAQAAGLEVVMDRCTKIEHARIFGGLNFIGVNTGIITAKRSRLTR